MNKLRYPVLVTGGSGFIGSHLVKRLLEDNCQVYVIDKEKGPNLEDVADRVTLCRIDLRDYNALKEFVKKIKPKKIFHLAACINRERSLSGAQELVDTNITGTKNLIESLENIDYDTFISAGSCEEYGPKNKAPFTEDMREDPSSPYSWTKTAIAYLLKTGDNMGGRRTVILRPTIVFGPNQRNNLLIPNVIVSALLGKELKLVSGKQTRDFIYVSDVVDAYIKAATVDDARGKIINVGVGKEESVRGIVVKILDMMGNPIEANFGTIPDPEKEIYSYYPDISLAKRVLEWEPRIGLEEGLKKTIAWYSEQYKRGQLEKWLV